MKVGDRVNISAAHYCTEGWVLDVRSIDELPSIPLMGRDQAVAILRDGGYVECAVLRYAFEDNGRKVELMFVALRDGKGDWWDLRGRALVITPVVEQISLSGLGANAYPD